MYVIDVMTFLVSQQYTPPNVEMCVVGVSAVEVAPSPFTNLSRLLGGSMARQCDGKNCALHPRGAASISNQQCPMMFGHNATGDE